MTSENIGKLEPGDDLNQDADTTLRIPTLTLTPLTPKQLASRKGWEPRKLRRRLWERVKAFWAKPRHLQVGRVTVTIREAK